MLGVIVNKMLKSRNYLVVSEKNSNFALRNKNKQL